MRLKFVNVSAPEITLGLLCEFCAVASAATLFTAK
jgi:hypothetical protein